MICEHVNVARTEEDQRRLQTMRIENPSELSQYADDLTQVFPDVLGLARGIDQNEAVAEAIAFHPIVLGFFNGFGRTMVRVASLRLKLDTEAQALVTYRAIRRSQNRFSSLSISRSQCCLMNTAFIPFPSTNRLSLLIGADSSESQQQPRSGAQW